VSRRAAAAASLLLVAGCGSSQENAVQADVARAAAQVRAKADDEELRSTIAKLEADEPTTGDERKARRLAIAGLRATLAGRASRRAFIENDRGNIEAATRDAKNAYAAFKRAARLLRAAEALAD
jgi:hypothetical protein